MTAKALAAAAALVALAATALLAWAVRYRPLALYAWSQRRALGKAGLEKSRLASPRLVYWKGGSGPVTLLVHGAGDHAGTWADVVPYLAGSRTLLVPDLPGHGESAPSEGSIRFATLVAGLDALLDAEAPAPARVTLVGSSMGAWLACVWAAAHPERVERLVLVNGGPLLGETHVDLLPKSRAEARALMGLLRAPGSLAVPDAVLDDLVRLGPTGPLARIVAGGDLPGFLMDGKLAGLATPVDLLWGEADRVVPLSYAEKMLAALPNARIATLAGCGHVPWQERPKAFGEKLAELLRSAPPRGKAAAP